MITATYTKTDITDLEGIIKIPKGSVIIAPKKYERLKKIERELREKCDWITGMEERAEKAEKELREARELLQEALDPYDEYLKETIQKFINRESEAE